MIEILSSTLYYKGYIYYDSVRILIFNHFFFLTVEFKKDQGVIFDCNVEVDSGFKPSDIIGEKKSPKNIELIHTKY